MSKFQPTTGWQNHHGQSDKLRDMSWWYFIMPHGVWFCRDGKVVLFNRALRPLVVRCPKEGLYRPRSCGLFDRSWDEWDGPTPDDQPDDYELPPYDVEHERRFYSIHKNPPWGVGRRAGETRVNITLIYWDFVLLDKMPERRG